MVNTISRPIFSLFGGGGALARTLSFLPLFIFFRTLSIKDNNDNYNYIFVPLEIGFFFGGWGVGGGLNNFFLRVLLLIIFCPLKYLIKELNEIK